MPVITPTGYRVFSMFCPIKSPPSTSIAPISPEDRILDWFLPHTFAAIGPDKNAIEAIGPEMDVAKAINSTEHIINVVRTKLIRTPRIIATWSPNASDCMPWRRAIIDRRQTTTTINNSGRESVTIPLRFPVIHLIAVGTSYSAAFITIQLTMAVKKA